MTRAIHGGFNMRAGVRESTSRLWPGRRQSVSFADNVASLGITSSSVAASWWSPCTGERHVAGEEHGRCGWSCGVGTRKAKDKTSGTPVTTFKRSNQIYWRAENHNSDLDRDNDRIACEKA